MMRKFTRLNDKINKKGFNFDPKKKNVPAIGRCQEQKLLQLWRKRSHCSKLPQADKRKKDNKSKHRHDSSDDDEDEKKNKNKKLGKKKSHDKKTKLFPKKKGHTKRSFLVEKKNG